MLVEAFGETRVEERSVVVIRGKASVRVLRIAWSQAVILH